MDFIPISDKASSTSTPTVAITATNLSVLQAPCMLPVLHFFVGPPTNLTGGRFNTETALYASILSFVNSTTVILSATSITNSECAAKDASVDVFSTSFSFHNYVALFYCDSISHSHIILSGRCHITNWYCNNFSFHPCNMWGTLDSDLENFSSPLQWDSTMNYALPNYYLNFTLAHLTVATSSKKQCLDFSSGDTVDIEMKEIGLRRIPSRDLSNSHFSPTFLVPITFFPPLIHIISEAPPPFHPWTSPY